jgi:hypothetical protein
MPVPHARDQNAIATGEFVEELDATALQPGSRKHGFHPRIMRC